MIDSPEQTGNIAVIARPKVDMRQGVSRLDAANNIVSFATKNTHISDIPEQVNAIGAAAVQSHEGIIGSTHPFRQITLDNGETTTVPTSRAAQAEKPLHVGVTSNIPSTPGYFRLLMPALMVRYLPQSVNKWVFGFDAPNDAKNQWYQFTNHVAKIAYDPSRKDVDLIKDFVKRVTNDGAKGVSDITADVLKANGDYQRVVDCLRGAGHPNNAETYLKNLCEQFIERENYKEVADTIPEMIESVHNANTIDSLKEKFVEFLDHHRLSDKVNMPGNNWKENIASIEQKLRENVEGYCFDTALGLGSLSITGFYAQRVLKDIYKTYAETVAYEKYIPVEKVTIADVFMSDNKMVQETCREFVEKNALRIGSDLLFFGRHLGRIPGLGALQSFPAGEMALGLKGLLLLTETQRKTTSMFTDLTEMIDRKLNPQHGLGDPMRASDLFDIYQKYNLTHNPDALFSDATSHDMQDSADWRLSNTIFARMADLMNTTYKYKHGFATHDDPLQQLTQEILGETRYFTLPKYLHLLGHDLIDLTQPEKTLAYIEIANNYGIQAVKDVRVLLEDKKIPLEEVLNTYAVDMQHTLNGSTSDALIAVSEKSRAIVQAQLTEYLELHPDVKAKYDTLVTEQLEKNLNAPDAVRPVVAFAASEKPPALPELSFFPADKESLPAYSNDARPVVIASNTVVPYTKITDGAHESRIQLVGLQKH